MGVPKLFYWLCRMHPGLLKKRLPADHVDCLYLDFNALIHECSLSSAQTSREAEEYVVKLLPCVLDDILDKYMPTKLLYIGVDGACPQSKINQQRSRRYLSAIESTGKMEGRINEENDILESGLESINSELDLSLATNSEQDEAGTEEKASPDQILEEYISHIRRDDCAFNRACITPGTAFMDRIHHFILSYVRHRLSTNPRLRGLTVIYSSYMVPGEGEQKMLNFIRRQSRINRDDLHLICSPDGDLFFLTLALHDHKVVVMRLREKVCKNMKTAVCTRCDRKGHTRDKCGTARSFAFSFIDVRYLRFLIVNKFKNTVDMELDERRLLSDWILVCFLMGNDFVPNIQCLHIDNNAMGNLRIFLSKFYSSGNGYITTDRGISHPRLRSFLRMLAAKEDYWNRQWMAYLGSSSEEPVEDILLHTFHGKGVYYRAKLGVATNAEIDNVCMRYLNCLENIYLYYVRGSNRWKWHFPFHFAPLLADLVRVEYRWRPEEVGYPLPPLRQLVLVTPPMTKFAVPEGLRSIYDTNRAYYPSVVKMDMFGTMISYQKAVILPFADPKFILRNIRMKLNELEYGVLVRNIPSHAILLTADPELVKRISTAYEKAGTGIEAETSAFAGTIAPDPFAAIPGESLNYGDDAAFENNTLSVIIR
jgi:5'-3' exonuclease